MQKKYNKFLKVKSMKKREETKMEERKKEKKKKTKLHRMAKAQCRCRGL